MMQLNCLCQTKATKVLTSTNVSDKQAKKAYKLMTWRQANALIVIILEQLLRLQKGLNKIVGINQWFYINNGSIWFTTDQQIMTGLGPTLNGLFI